jgi:RimJ/RimL family protein N-acetyltransferase
MISDSCFRNQPVLEGERVRLEPLGLEHLEGAMEMLSDPEGARMTATSRTFEEAFVREWLATRQDHDDRADYAIIRRSDDSYLGEVVLNDLDTDDACVNYRIGLLGPGVYGRGYGTEATGLLLDYAFNEVGLHRVELEVYAFNPRAQRSYEKCGFVREGVRRKALYWDDEWHDVIVMGILATDPRPAGQGAHAGAR